MTPWILYVAVGRADAVELVSKWNTAKGLRYHAESRIETPKLVEWKAYNNLDARAAVTDVALDMTCDGAPVKKQIVVKCHLDKATIAARAAMGQEQEKLDKIMREWSEHLTGADVMLTLGSDGHVALFGLEGVERKNARQGEVIESQRQLLRRVFAPFDIAVPKAMMAEPNEPWKHKGAPLQMGLLAMTDMNTAGAASMTHTIDRMDGSNAYLVTDGHSVMDTPESQFQKIDLIVHGQARYDVAEGLIEYSDLDLNGELTAGSINSQNPQYYRQVSWIGRIEPDGAYAAARCGEAGRRRRACAPDSDGRAEHAADARRTRTRGRRKRHHHPPVRRAARAFPSSALVGAAASGARREQPARAVERRAELSQRVSVPRVGERALAQVPDRHAVAAAVRGNQTPVRLQHQAAVRVAAPAPHERVGASIEDLECVAIGELGRAPYGKGPRARRDARELARERVEIDVEDVEVGDVRCRGRVALAPRRVVAIGHRVGRVVRVHEPDALEAQVRQIGEETLEVPHVPRCDAREHRDARTVGPELCDPVDGAAPRAVLSADRVVHVGGPVERDEQLVETDARQIVASRGSRAPLVVIVVRSPRRFAYSSDGRRCG